MCHWPPHLPPPARVLSLHPPPRLSPDAVPRPAGLLVECPVLGGIASLLPRLLLLRAAVTLTMKGPRFGFQGCRCVSVRGGLSQSGTVRSKHHAASVQHRILVLLKALSERSLILPRHGLLYKAALSEALCSLVHSSQGGLRCGLKDGGRTTVCPAW